MDSFKNRVRSAIRRSRAAKTGRALELRGPTIRGEDGSLTREIVQLTDAKIDETEERDTPDVGD